MSCSEGDGYIVVEGWGKLPEGWRYTQVSGVAVDSRDNAYVFCRGEHPVIIFDRKGEFLGSWGEGVFTQPHGIYIDVDDHVYCIDSGDHTVRKTTVDGEMLMTLGTEGKPAAEGDPFNRPTDAGISPTGEIYVTDGYGNARVHKFSPEGVHLFSWGKPGDGPGQFDLPHGVWVDGEGRVYVADRQNNRIQIFTSEGKYIEAWTDLKRPCSIRIDEGGRVHVAELAARMSVLDRKGRVLARWGGEESTVPGLFRAPHCACTDSRGDLYVGEVLEGQRIQKFTLKG